MKKQINVLMCAALIAGLFVVSSCSSGGGGGGFFLPSKPGSFVLVSPGDNDNASLVPTLSWTVAAQATSYTVELSSAATFTPLLLKETVAAPGTNLVSNATLTDSLTYYWRVTAANSFGTSVATAGTRTYAEFTARSSGGVQWAEVSKPTGTGAEAGAVALDSGVTKTWMYVVGYDTNTAGQDGQWRIEKRKLSDGSFDPAFGADGIVTNNPGNDFDDAYGITVFGSNIYVVGYETQVPSGKERWRIEKRTTASGELVAGFGNNGVVISTPTPTGSFNEPNASTTDGTSLYVVGFETDASDIEQWRFEKFNLSTGQSLTVQTSATGTIGRFSNAATAVVYDSGLYVTGYDSLTGTLKWRVEKRDTDGNYVPGFGDAGVVSSATFTFNGYARALAASTTDLFIAGVDQTGGTFKWCVAKLDKITGALDAIFGGGSGLVVSSGAGDLEPFSLAIVDTSLYIAGYQTTASGDWAWRLEKRNMSSGALDVNFGMNGVVVYDPSAGDDLIYAMATDGAALYLAGSDLDPSKNVFEWRIEKRTK